MNILITGAGGFIGQAFVQSLSPKHKIIALSSGRGASGNMQGCDLTSQTKTQKFIKTFKGPQIDAIVHLASMVCTPQNAKNPSLLEDNQAITVNTIALAQALKPKILVHASSMAVYPNRDGLYRENGLVDPSANSDGLYGLSKFNAEVLFNFFLSSTMEVLHLRMTQVYGPGMRQDRIFPAMLRELIEKNSITVFGQGQRITNFIHIKDVVSTVNKVLLKPQSGVYNVGSHDHLTLEQWAKKMISQFGRAGSRIIKVPQGSSVKQRIDTRLLDNVFGITNKTLDLNGILRSP